VRELQAVETDGGEVDLSEFRNTINGVLRSVSTSEYQADALLGQLDLAELMVLLEQWMETTQPGEAQPSSS
jgi:hypothetical protein